MNTINIGDIFVSSWGYDQTNIDFYQVIAKTAKMVTLRMIKKERVSEPHSMGAYVMPLKDQFLESDHAYDKEYGKPFKRRVFKGYEGEVIIKIGCSIAKKWNGLRKTETYTA